MGLAIIIPGADFSSANLGKVTLVENVPLSSLSIVGPNSISAPTVFSVSYLPVNTTQRGIVWSIQSGGAYASINPTTGELSPEVGTSDDEVVIRATSQANSTIYAEKTVSVSASTWYAEKTGLVGDGIAKINTGYVPIETTELRYDFKIDRYPEITNTPKYLTLWSSYSAESSPLSRHLLIVTVSSGDKQAIYLGADNATQVRKGIVANDTALPEIGVREVITLSLQDCVSSVRTFNVTKKSGFAEQSIPIVLYSSFLASPVSCEMTYYSFKIFEGLTLVKDFVPATLMTNISGEYASDGNSHNAGENGFIEKVSGKFYGNVAGSGSFSVIN